MTHCQLVGLLVKKQIFLSESLSITKMTNPNFYEERANLCIKHLEVGLNYSPTLVENCRVGQRYL